MRKSTRLLVASLLPAFVLAGMANPATAQEKKMGKTAAKAPAGEVTLKEIEQNDKLRVYEATYKPGDVSPSFVIGCRRALMKSSQLPDCEVVGADEKIRRPSTDGADY